MTDVPEPPVGLPSHVVWELAGMPASTLNYWVQTGLVKPSLRRQEGKRVEQWWSIRDVVIVRTVRALRASGAPMAKIRKARRLLEAWGEDLSEMCLYWDGVDLLVTDSHGSVFSGAKRPAQHVMMFMALPVDAWEAEARTHPGAEAVDLERFKNLRAERRKNQKQRLQRHTEILRGDDEDGQALGNP